MRIVSVSLFGIALIITGQLACRPSEDAFDGEVIALINARLIDGSGSEPVDDITLVIDNGQITAVGPATEISVPDGAREIDLDGDTVLPGLIDGHVHLSSALRRDPEAAATWLQAGVTTLIDMGTRRDPDEFRAALAADPGGAPRLLLAGPILTAPGGYPFVGPRSSALEIASVDDAESLLAPLLAGPRIDHLKLVLDRGFTDDLDDEGWPVLEPNVLRAITELAHARQLRVSAHVTQADELTAALTAGVDNAAHTPTEAIPDEVLELAVGADFVLVSTASLWLDTAEELAAVQHNLRRYLDLGGRVALGTDAPGFQDPGLPLVEMRLLEAAGLSPMEVIVAATRDAAFAFGREHDLGRVAPGYVADLVVVTGDPLRDLEVLANISLVVQAGQIVRYPGE